MIRRRDIANLDWALFAAYLALSLLGAAFIWSARSSLQPGGIVHGTAYFQRQLQWLLISFVAFLGVLFFDYETYRRYAYLIYAVGIGSLIWVLLFGSEIRGTSRWIRLGGFQVQPSEFVKIAVVLALARYLMYRRDQGTAKGLLAPISLVLVPMGLIVVEPDLGTSCVLIPVLFAVLYVGGARLGHLAALAGSALAAAPFLWFLVMSQAQRGRITSFINPHADPTGSGFHVIQALIAIGSGGLTGKGFASGTQHLLRQVPAADTDFIFAVIAEEWGFLGGLMVIALFFILFTRAMEIASQTREPFGRLVAVGGVAILFFQVAVNIGMTMRLCPITGLTLPLLSYGGSSLLSCSIIVALILNVGMRRKTVVAPDDFDL